MVASIKADRIKMLENPHRSAGFAVLKAPDIPSVLVEVGFLSNRGEADKLSSPKYRQLVANSLKGGIDVYFNQLERNQMQ
jgi:N-acetylmuramoyl-L-alanine amidase